MTKYQIKEAKGFAVCISKFTVLRNGKIVHRTDDASEAHRFVQSQINMDRDFDMEHEFYQDRDLMGRMVRG